MARGTIEQRSPGSWRLRIDRGYVRDPKTGALRRKQQSITVRGTRKDAEDRLHDALSDLHKGAFIEPSKITVGQWLTEWVDKAIKPPRRTERTYQTYRSVITLHLEPALGHLRLQALRPLDVEAFIASKAPLAPATLEKIHVILSSALKAAAKNSLVARNVAALISNRPEAPKGHATVLANYWTAEESAAFLRAARDADPQSAALWSLALDSGMRRSELAGLMWKDLDLAAGRVLIARQLLHGGKAPTFTPPKGKRARTIDLAPETLDRLRSHKAAQSALKLRQRPTYHDHGLVFAKETGRLLGCPLDWNNLGDRGFASIIKAAGIRRITIHGLRHTVATLLLAAGVAPHIVRDRLGHADIETTLTVYAHALPGQQRDAARLLGALIYGS